MAMALNLTFETPELVKQLSEMFLMVPADRIPFLDRLHDAVISNPPSSEISPAAWADAWWLDLSSASFPEYSVSHTSYEMIRILMLLFSTVAIKTGNVV
jgi:hypothetical protein